MPMIGGPVGSDLDPTSAQYQSAAASCPFDSGNLSQAAFASAWQQWNAAHPAGSASGMVPEQVLAGQ